MAKWYYFTDGQPAGPIDPAALKQLATSGRLKPTDKVRREDLAEWYEARQVKGLFTASKTAGSNSPAQTTATVMADGGTPAPKASAVPKVLHPSNNIPHPAMASAEVASKMPSKRTKRVVFAMGAIMFVALLLPAVKSARDAQRRRDLNTSKKPDTSSADHLITDRNLNTQLRTVMEAEKALRETVEAVGGLDKGMLLQLIPTINEGQNYHNTFEDQSFFWKLSKETHRDWNTWRDAFVALQRSMNSDPDIIQKLAGALNGNDSSVAEAAAYALMRQREKALPAVPALIKCLQGSNRATIVASCEILANLKAKEAISQLNELSKSDEQYKQRSAEYALKQINAPSAEELREEEAKVRAHEEKLREAQVAAEESARKREEAEHIAQAEKETKAREQDEAEQKAKSEAAARQAQIDRRQLAEKLFSGISLEPKIQLTRSARSTRAVAEIRGPQLPKIRALLDGKDWLGLINYVGSTSPAGFGENNFPEFPDNYVIEQTANQLSDFKFIFLVKLPKPIDASQLVRVYLRDVDEQHYADIATWRTDWEIGPDGKSYLCPWSPADGDIVLVFGKYEQLNELVSQQTISLRDQYYALSTKTKLGEIDEQAAHNDFMPVMKKAREAIAKRILTL